MWESADPTSMLLPPLPNFLFQRDPSCWIFDGVTINPMTKPARKPESMIVEAIYRFHPMFAAEQFPIWLGGADEDWGRAHVEGGDVQPIGNGAVMIGMGERTTPQAVLWIARSLFRAGSARARARRAPAEVAQLHAPRHRDHDVRPRPRHAVPRGRSTARAPGRSVPATSADDLVDRGAARAAARAHGQGARRARRCASSRPAATSSRPSASSGTTATTSSRSSRASSSPTSATSAPTPRCARPASRSSPSRASSSAAAAAARTA